MAITSRNLFMLFPYVKLEFIFSKMFYHAVRFNKSLESRHSVKFVEYHLFDVSGMGPYICHLRLINNTFLSTKANR